jgi:LmbE family N-acetylglucosaminyl deacetylase
MKTNSFKFVRQAGTERRLTDDLFKVLGVRDPRRETWLFVSPHDDDLCIGSALWLQAAVSAGIKPQVLIVTDGRMGYCSLAQRTRIAKIRQAETYESFEILGIPRNDIAYIGYPDGGLYTLGGRRQAQRGEKDIRGICGYIGLQNAFTYHLRRVRPNRVFVPTPTDLHPDHQITHNELMISLFHASGQIWPELGSVIDPIAAVYEMAIYCDFSDKPGLGIRGNPAAFRRKLDSIAAYRSQVQIAQVVAQIRAAGPYEFLREVEFNLYSASKYVGMFK